MDQNNREIPFSMLSLMWTRNWLVSEDCTRYKIWGSGTLSSRCSYKLEPLSYLRRPKVLHVDSGIMQLLDMLAQVMPRSIHFFFLGK